MLCHKADTVLDVSPPTVQHFQEHWFGLECFSRLKHAKNATHALCPLVRETVWGDWLGMLHPMVSLVSLMSTQCLIVRKVSDKSFREGAVAY